MKSIPWQVFSQNGQPIAGESHSGEAFTQASGLVQGNSHVWIWRRNDHDVQILLQKRSLNKENYPGWLHLSAGGHIDIGESAQDAAIREVKEELDISLKLDDLYFLQVVRGNFNSNDLMSVFIAKMPSNQEVTIDPVEVDSVLWVDLKTFATQVKHPERYNVLPLGNDYFSSVVSRIKLLSQE